MTIGERIKEVRTKMGMSQVDFADKINVSKQTLYKYENNIITNIPFDKIEEAARIGGVSPGHLMGWGTDTDVGMRITAIRKALKFSPKEFAKKLGISESVLNDIEQGAGVSELLVRAICHEFKVNRHYLLNGEGSMFDELPECILDEMYKQYHMDALDRSIVIEYLKLSEPQRKIIKDLMQNLIENNKKEAEKADTEELEAAHDDGATAEQKKHADDIMHDPSEWE